MRYIISSIAQHCDTKGLKMKEKIWPLTISRLLPFILRINSRISSKSWGLTLCNNLKPMNPPICTVKIEPDFALFDTANSGKP